MAHHEDNPWAKEYEENSKSGKKSDVVGMTWKSGEHSIRILPAIVKGEVPFVKYIVHWIPVTTGKKDRPIVHGVDTKCPVCKFVSSLWSEVYRLKEEEDMTDEAPEVKKLLKQISKLRGKKTYDMNILDRNDYRDENGNIKIKRLVAGPTIWKPIIELGNSEKWGNPSAQGSRGYDLTVTVDGEGIKREYTILPDPERKPLTEDEVKALEKAYDLKKLRKFSSAKEILDILENAKAPLDTINLKKIKKDLLEDENIDSDDDDEEEKPKRKKAPVQEPDDDDDDVIEPEDEDEDPKATAKAKKESKKEEKAFASDDDDEQPVRGKKNNKKVEEDTSDDDDSFNDDSDDDSDNSSLDSDSDDSDTSDDSDDDSSNDDSSSDDVSLDEMDCRGTHDPDDVGCKECSISGECKKLQKEFNVKAEKYGLDIDGMSGFEIEKALKKKEEEASKKGKVGKSGKAGSSESTGKKRELPF